MINFEVSLMAMNFVITTCVVWTNIIVIINEKKSVQGCAGVCTSFFSKF